MKKDTTTRMDDIIDPLGAESSEIVMTKEAASLASGAIDRLDGRQEFIIRGYFGIGARRQTLEEMGQDLGISGERVRQIRERALKKMGFDPALRTHMPGR